MDLERFSARALFSLGAPMRGTPDPMAKTGTLRMPSAHSVLAAAFCHSPIRLRSSCDHSPLLTGPRGYLWLGTADERLELKALAELEPDSAREASEDPE